MERAARGVRNGALRSGHARGRRGAGGGGHLLILAKPHDHKKIVSSLKRFTHIDFDLENEGTKIIYQNNKIYS